MAMENHQETMAIRNIGRRPLSLTFADETVRVLPKKTSEFYPMRKWKEGHGFAYEQASKFVADREAIWVKGLPEGVKEASVGDIFPTSRDKT